MWSSTAERALARSSAMELFSTIKDVTSAACIKGSSETTLAMLLLSCAGRPAVQFLLFQRSRRFHRSLQFRTFLPSLPSRPYLLFPPSRGVSTGIRFSQGNRVPPSLSDEIGASRRRYGRVVSLYSLGDRVQRVGKVCPASQFRLSLAKTPA